MKPAGGFSLDLLLLPREFPSDDRPPRHEALFFITVTLESEVMDFSKMIFRRNEGRKEALCCSGKFKAAVDSVISSSNDDIMIIMHFIDKALFIWKCQGATTQIKLRDGRWEKGAETSGLDHWKPFKIRAFFRPVFKESELPAGWRDCSTGVMRPSSRLGAPWWRVWFSGCLWIWWSGRRFVE